MFFMRKNTEGRLETRLVYPQDFLLPVVGWMTYARRDSHPNKLKEKIYGVAIHAAQAGWLVGLGKLFDKYHNPILDYLGL